MQLQELHIYSEKSSSDTKISIKNKGGEILFECCYSNDVIPTFNPIELLRLSLEGDIDVSFQIKTTYGNSRIGCEQSRSETCRMNQ
ncbi:hypothetical protein ACMSFF_26305 [Bacteroides faecis]